MPNVPLHLSDQSGGLEPTAFQAQLRRLESLQTLMTQGGAVVSEVAQFLAKAREELSALQREQEGYAQAQERLAEEKDSLAAQCADALRAADDAQARATLSDRKVEQLQALLAVSEERVPKSDVDQERLRGADQLRTATERIGALEAELARERQLREQAASRARHQEASVYAADIALLKNRLSALEHQLEAERERRVRLMDVVKVHEVSVVPQRQRESV